MSIRQFTWANILSDPTYKKRSRLMGTDWEAKFPMVSICALEYIEGLSGHAPIHLIIGTPRPQCTCRFKFELGLHHEGFHDMVKRL
jgi:hypothetical protein